MNEYINKNTNLKNYGFQEKYVFCFTGNIIDTKRQKIVKPYNNYMYKLKDNNNNTKSISLKTLYRTICGEEYCIDRIINLDNEVWKKMIYHDDRLYISSCGRIKSYCGYTAIIKKCQPNTKGYLRVKIKGKYYSVARLVGQYFIKEYSPLLSAHHIDLCRTNNSITNILFLDQPTHLELHKTLRSKTNG